MGDQSSSIDDEVDEVDLEKQPPLIAANTTLEQDNATVLAVWSAMGGEDDTLMKGYWHDGVGKKMRDEPSDDVSEWLGVRVEEVRVTILDWAGKGLVVTIPAEIGALCAFQILDLSSNALSSSIAPTIGALTNLKTLVLSHNPLSGVVPSTLSNLTNLTNLELLWLYGTNLTDAPTYRLNCKPVVQDYLSTLWRPQALRFLKYGVAITKKQQDMKSTTTTSTEYAPPAPDPFFAFLTRCEDATDHILSFLDPLNHGVERKRG